MNEELLKQIIAELIESTGAAMGAVVAALAHQIDPEKFAADLRSQIKASEKLPKWPPLATQLATHALAAAEAETALRKRSTH